MQQVISNLGMQNPDSIMYNTAPEATVWVRLYLFKGVLGHRVEPHDRLVGLLDYEVLALVQLQAKVNYGAHNAPAVLHVQVDLHGKVFGLAHLQYATPFNQISRTKQCSTACSGETVNGSLVCFTLKHVLVPGQIVSLCLLGGTSEDNHINCGPFACRLKHPDETCSIILTCDRALCGYCTTKHYTSCCIMQM